MKTDTEKTKKSSLPYTLNEILCEKARERSVALRLGKILIFLYNIYVRSFVVKEQDNMDDVPVF